MPTRLILLCLLVTTLFASPALAQVNGSGTSPSSDFDIVLNLPGDEAIVTGASGESIGGVPGETIQLNVNDGGRLGGSFAINSGGELNISGGNGGSFDANSGSEVNISGGDVSIFDANAGSEVNISGGEVFLFDAHSGSEVNISGGSIFANSEAHPGSKVNISGGTVCRFFTAHPGSNVEIFGNEFELNGSPFSGATISLDSGDIFTGTLTDGSKFIFEQDSNLSDVQLTPVALPQLDISPIVVTTPNPDLPSGLRSGQTLTLLDGGELGNNFELVDATLNIQGGVLGSGAGALDSVVNISAGAVASGFNAYSGSEVNITGGTVGQLLASSDSEVNISGGDVSIFARSGSEVTISGGTVTRSITAQAGSNVELFGNEFELNGSPFSGATISLDSGDILTGTLADGSKFIFAEEASDRISNGQLTRVALPPLDISPIVVSTPNPDLPSGLRSGQTLTLLDGGELGNNFELVDATLNIQGGVLGSKAGALDSVVNISGGRVAFGFSAYSGSELNITGGTVGQVLANSGSEVNISGGSVAGISPPSFFGSDFLARPGSKVNLFGRLFALDGVPLSNLTVDTPLTITSRDGTLSGLLADRSAFSLDFSPEFGFGSPIDPDATLTVTLVLLLGDVNQDGVVDFSDIPAFISILIAGDYLAEADINEDDVVDFSDIPHFIEILLAS